MTVSSGASGARLNQPPFSISLDSSGMSRLRTACKDNGQF